MLAGSLAWALVMRAPMRLSANTEARRSALKDLASRARFVELPLTGAHMVFLWNIIVPSN
jgi:hypothetical protein